MESQNGSGRDQAERFSRPCGEELRWGLKTESIWVRGKGLPSYGKSNKIVKKKILVAEEAHLMPAP